MSETEDKLWREMLDSELTSEYYATLAGRFSKRDKFAKIFLAVMSSGTVAGWSIWHGSNANAVATGAWRGLSAAAAVTSIVLPILNYSKKVEWASTLKAAYRATTNDLGSLWLRRGTLTEAGLVTALDKILEKEETLAATESHFPERDDKLLKQCQQCIIKRRGI